MRMPFTGIIQGQGRRPQREHMVPFKALLPLSIRNRVSGKSDSSSDVACLQEMAVLFACLKDNEFAEKLCPKEIATFEKCYKVHMDKKFEAKKTDSLGIVAPGKDLNYKQLNKFMRFYPNPK
ncbi:uncharacterized protein LOC129906202 [Episyrphus balteatus]|uniref:uncharacterized protein LOC129906202 n=1 Tax=Episyrphus balteatus TaxID=286459 RepID=UPI0024862E5A|nr:uncharacterized protein LOC129906202 [Episyrphus balteatus]